jgi:hypothetical protein
MKDRRWIVFTLSLALVLLSLAAVFAGPAAVSGLLAATPVAALPQLRPFRFNTRQRIVPFGDVTYGVNARRTLQLPKTGYLNRLFLSFRGVHTAVALTTLADLGPWNLFRRITLSANLGAGEIFSLSGYEAFILSCLQDQGFRPDAAGAGSVTPDADLYAAGVAAGANTWNLNLIIPVAANNGGDFDLGLINLQSPQLNMTLSIDFGDVTDAVAAANSTFTGTVYVDAEVYDYPDPTIVAQPVRAFVRTLSDVQNIGNVGDNRITIPPMGELLQLIHIVRINSTRSNAVDSLRVRLNHGDTPYDVRRWVKKLITRQQAGIDLPTGVYLHDFFHAQEGMSEGDNRDTLNTERITTLDFIVNITAGTALGAAGTNTISTVRRIVQMAV